jgi:hypothetical protein
MAHGRLMKTMFWTGALLALVPVALGLIVVGVVLHARRQSRREGEPGDRS